MKIQNSNITEKGYVFQDLDLSFIIHPIRKDLILVKDDKDVEQSMKNLILTRHYERPFKSEIGSNVHDLLFEFADSTNFLIAERDISDVIRNFEPRVKLESVEVISESDHIVINIYYYIISSTEIKLLQIPMTKNN